MTDFITALTANVNAPALWGAITDAAGLISIAVLFAFSYKLIKKVVKGISGGKAKM